VVHLPIVFRPKLKGKPLGGFVIITIFNLQIKSEKNKTNS
jgi:hypothetical protein